MNPKLWEFIESKKIHMYDDKIVPTNIYYCNNCVTLFVLPGWFTPYYRDPRRLLERHLTCCKNRVMFFLIRKDEVEKDGMIFEPSRPTFVWVIPDFWINSAVVADELL